MKILITGASGMLGHDLKKVLGKENQLICTDINNLDITKKRKVMNFLKRKKPELVIHAAAFTGVDEAEKKKYLSMKINRDGTKNITLAAKFLDIPVLYISTDYIFSGGKKIPYKEGDQPKPLSIYGKTKLEGEREIKKITSKYYIVRSAWLYGKRGKNFINTIIELSKNNKELKIVDDQRGCPTYTLDLAGGIEKLIKRNKYGVYHIVNSGNCTWYELAKEIAKIKKLNNNIIPITTKELARPAKRPKYSVLSNQKAKSLGINMRKWEAALKDFLSNKTAAKNK